MNSYEFTAEGRTVRIMRNGRADYADAWRVVWPSGNGSLKQSPVRFSSLTNACRAVRMAVSGFL